MENTLAQKTKQLSTTTGRIAITTMASLSELNYEYLLTISNAAEESEFFKEQYEKFGNDELFAIPITEDVKELFDQKLVQNKLNPVGEKENIKPGAYSAELAEDEYDNRENVYVYTFSKDDLAKVRQIKEQVIEEKLDIHLSPKQNNLKLEKLSYAEVQLIDKHLAEQGLIKEYDYTFSAGSGSTSVLLYNKEDKQVIDHAKVITEIELQDIDGDKLKEIYAYRKEQKNNIGKDMFAQNQVETFYVVNEQYTLKVEPESVIVSKGGMELITIPKHNEHTSNAVMSYINKMDEFARMSEKEYQDFSKLSDKAKIDTIKQIAVEKGAPTMTHAEIVSAAGKKAHLQDIVQKVNRSMTVLENTSLSALDDIYMVSGEQIEQSVLDTEIEVSESQVVEYAMDTKTQINELKSQTKEYNQTSAQKMEALIRGELMPEKELLEHVKQLEREEALDMASMTEEEREERMADLKNISAAGADLLSSIYPPEETSVETNLE